MITVTLRKRKTRKGNIYLYLDIYPGVFDPVTFKMRRNEALGIKLYANPKDANERAFNKKMMQFGEQQRCKRQIEIMNEEYGLTHKNMSHKDFLVYFYSRSLKKHDKWMATYKHFHKFMKGKCTFGALSVALCDRFKEYLLNDASGKNAKGLAQNTASAYFGVFREILVEIYRAKYIKDDLNAALTPIKCKRTQKPYLTFEEVRRLQDTPCPVKVLKDASMFSILTGFRISDILTLDWEHVTIAPDGGPCVIKNIEKSGREEINYISQLALDYCGPRSSGLVFKGLTRVMTYTVLKKWVKDAGIAKHVTFHTFRHTNATLLSSSGIDIYTVSKMLNHMNVGTTQIYAEVVDEKKRIAADALPKMLDRSSSQLLS